MHQQSRHPPRVSSPASSPQTNPTRTNNPRDRGRSGSTASGQDVIPGSEGPGGAAGRSAASPESIKKLDQIIQNLYAKAAVIVLQSRMNPAQTASKKKNLWFSIETAETIDDFREELRVYKLSGCFENRPPPLIIETYIDASNLNSGQSMVVVDENGKRWDVLEALNLEDAEDDSPRRRQPQARNTEVVLERWRFELQCLSGLNLDEDFGQSLPTIYKKAIVFFRAFFAMSRLFPCWRFSQHALTKAAHPALEVKCRVLSAEPEYPTYDPLRQPLYHGEGREVATEYVFADLEVPVGRFSASVRYRTEVNFRVDDSESLLSSRFMGVDENFFKPSIPRREARHGRSDSYAEPGSLPSRRRQGRGGIQEAQQTYGSLSTFHGDGALGTSPITALRQARPIGSDTSSPTESPSASSERPDPPHSLPIRSSAGVRPSLRTSGESSRRTSISFQPFKAGSLSGSPRLADMEAPSSPQSLTRPSGLSALARAANKSSLQAGMAASLRGPSAPSPQDVPVLSASPKPASRYSSSFSHRRSRPSFGGQSRNADDDQASSGKQSLSSSAQPGSGLLTDLYSGGAGSSGSYQTDDDNIGDFLKALDTHKTLKSFEPGKNGESSAASKRTAAQLSKFQMMRESHAVLSDSMTSSMQLRSVTGTSPSTSRQLMGPSLVGPSSAINMSTSTSPGGGMASGKPLSSPHTPHTPAIPSRLSENSIIDYQQPASGRHRHSGIDPTEEEGDVDDGETPIATGQEGRGTGAIDIPLSPRLFHHDGRRTVASIALGGEHQSLQSAEGGVSISAPASGVSPTKIGDDDDIPPANLTGGIARGGSSRYLNRGGGGSGSGSRPGSFSSITRGAGKLNTNNTPFIMFRAAAAGPYDEAINKATDENLTSEDWGAIMEVCDRVASDSNGSKEAVQSMIKRLAHRNANVQLYTLEVANALSQNCGKNMHRELSSRAFTDALLKLANDRNTHNQVKAKILERMKEWSDMFKSDPDLGIMYDAYFRLKQSNPTLHPPSAPQKNSLTDQDRLKEEEELQIALKLSLQEEERKKKPAQAASVAGPSSSSGAGAAGSSGAAAQQAAAPVQQQVPSGTTAATVSRVRALYDFVPSEPGELEFKKGDVIAVLESVYKDWWRGSLKGKTGIFPLNYVEKLTDPTPDELQREAQMEAEVFAEIKNVEKLLTLLSASNTAPREEDNEEISKLYHQTLAIRPKLIKLIEKYSQKKDDFTQLNEKFIKARRDYEALLESSMSHPPGPNYHQYAMRPQIPQGYPPQQGGYGGPSQPQDPQRFYTPAPTQEPSQYPPQSPSPNYHRPGQSVGGGAPVYFAGAEVPPQANQPPSQTPQQQPPQQQQAPPQPQQQPPQQPPSQQGYAPRPQDQRVPSGGKQPAPIQTSTSPPPQGQYVPYSQNPGGGAPVRPQSTYGSGPQELSTSAYDSPIASHHNPSGYYTTAANPSAPEDPYSASTPSAPSAPPPAVPGAEHQRQPSYGQYNAYQAAAAGRYDAGGHGGADSPLSPPPPLQPSGPAFDSRQGLPSRVEGGGGPPQYKAYVPPSGVGGVSADEGDSYYRGGGY
ncbi:autophagy-related protein 13 [Cladorrhinum sp. PSN332]|nr:autophagy-related protein 13 [Cladorrhinum sp. PSN332]